MPLAAEDTSSDSNETRINDAKFALREICINIR